MSRVGSRSAVSLCGVPVRVESVRALAGMLDGDELGEKLERAVANNNAIVALSVPERERIVHVLERAPAGLASLRAEMSAQLKRRRDQEAKLERDDRHREFRAQRAATQKPSGTDDIPAGA